MRNATKLAGLTALALTVSVTLTGGRAASADDKAKKSPAETLVGAYTIVSGESAGVPEPEDRIKGSIVRFSADRVVVFDKESKELFGASYKLDSGETPWRITMTSKLSANDGQVAKGLIEKDDETVRLIYALPGGQPPTEFKTKEKQLMFVMKPKKS